jgi:uncharacterized alpha-E superfamily protein
MLLSRVADHLYWMSRYLERAEHTARLIDVSLNMMLEQAPQAAERRFLRLLRSLHVQQDADAPTDAYHLTQRLTFDAGTPNAIVSCIASARENAQHVRELISSEMWEQINLLYLHISRTRMDTIWNAHSHDFFRAVKEGSHLFQGITDSTMTQGEGWQFIQIGRYRARQQHRRAGGCAFHRSGELCRHARPHRRALRLSRLGGLAEVLHRV